MVDITKVRAIDIHTHAEEPCGCHADDGYDDLQATMAKYFRAPWEHPPTVPETAAHRDKAIRRLLASAKGLDRLLHELEEAAPFK